MARDQQSEGASMLGASMIQEPETKSGGGSGAPIKRRPRGNVYGKYLWGSNPLDSGELDYVRKHGEEAISKALDEDTHWKYVSLKQVQDVRLYTPLAAPDDDSNAAAAVAPTSTTPTRSLSSTSSSSTKERTSAPPRILPGRCDYRAMTRVPGSIDTVMEILAADEDREAYWTAINTQKGLRACNMFGSRRLSAEENFPRWSQKYMATRFTKYSTKSVDFCFAEYSKYAPGPTKEGEPRRGFIYRRSVDESLFAMDEIKARLAKFDDECERMYIQDWLYEISETQERDVCKVILTCAVYFSGDYSRSLRTEFHEFTTDILIQLRKVLAKHWKEKYNEEALSAETTAASIFSNAFVKVKPGQSRYCGVCSTTFTVLRKRYSCKTCNVSMCSKCTKTSSSTGGANNSNKECILCYQFSDGTPLNQSRSSFHRHFRTPNNVTSSIDSTAVSTYSEDDYESEASSSSRGDRPPELIRLFDPETDLKPAAASKRVVRKIRVGSSDSSKSVPGVMLFSEVDALTLSASSRGAKTTSSLLNPDAGRTKRPIRAVSEDNVLTKDESSVECDDLANFNLKLL
ncbi:hypothetical protein FI667_g4728, partial [Globisporangium splendens]